MNLLFGTGYPHCFAGTLLLAGVSVRIVTQLEYISAPQFSSPDFANRGPVFAIMWACASESATQDILHKKAKKIEIMPSLLAPTAAADPTQALLAYPRDDSQTSEDHGPGSNHPIEPGEAALSGLGSTI